MTEEIGLSGYSLEFVAVFSFDCEASAIRHILAPPLSSYPKVNH